MKAALLHRTFLVVLSLVAVNSASAGTITTWSGTGSGTLWSQTGNWTIKPTVSGTTFSLVYRGNPTRTTSTNDIGLVKVDSILFSNNGASGSTSSFILNRSGTASISLANGGVVTTTAAVSGTTVGGASGETISSPIALLGSGTFNIGTGHNLTLSGSLTGGGSIVKNGDGSLFLSGANSLSALDINQGAVVVNATSFAGISGLTIDIGSSGQTAIFRANSVGTPVARSAVSTNFRIGGNSNVTLNGSSNLTFNAAQFNVADPTVTSPAVVSLIGGGAGSAGTQIINGVIQDNSGSGKVGVTIGGGNVWNLNGVNTYTGDTTVDATGRLLLDGQISAASSVTSSGVVAGSGTFGGAVTISSGTLAPGGTSVGGVLTDSIGTLTVGSLSLGSTATTQLTITGSTNGMYDEIVGSSTLNYGGTLALTISDLTTTYDDHTVFNLFSGFTSTSGSLASITLSAVGTAYDGLTFTGPDSNGDWYTGWTAGNQELKFSQANGTLTVVPEPSTIVFAGIGIAMFGWSTWTRRRANIRRQAIEAAIV